MSVQNRKYTHTHTQAHAYAQTHTTDDDVSLDEAKKNGKTWSNSNGGAYQMIADICGNANNNNNVHKLPHIFPKGQPGSQPKKK